MKNFYSKHCKSLIVILCLAFFCFGEIGAQVVISDDFETWSPTQTTTSCTVGTLGAVGNNWTQDQSDGGEWRLDMGGTPSGTTGPSVDYNPGTSTGKYMYTESSSPCYGTECNLISPVIDLSYPGNDYMTFAYHMYGSTQGTLYVDIWTAGSWTNLWSMTGDQRPCTKK